MTTIEKKEYQWSKFFVNGELATGFISALLAIVSSLKGDTAGTVVFIFFLVLSVFGFLHFFYLIKNKTYIQVTDDELNIFPKYFKGKPKTIKWADVSKFEIQLKKQLTLTLLPGERIKVNLGYLNKADRDNFIQIVTEKVENKPQT